MPRDNTKEVKIEAGDVAVFNPEDFQSFHPDEPMIVGVYRDGIDIRHITIRNFEPGQVSDLHIHPENAHCIYILDHPENAHCIYILEGSGEVLRDGAPPLPIKVGQFLVVPRNTLHGLRNTGDRRLSYLGVNAGAEPDQ